MFLYGLVVDHGSSANFIAVNDADNVLHLALGAGMIALGLILGGRAAREGAGVRGSTLTA